MIAVVNSSEGLDSNANATLTSVDANRRKIYHTLSGWGFNSRNGSDYNERGLPVRIVEVNPEQL